MARLIILTIVAAAVVIAWHSGSVLLIMAAVCGACGIASLTQDATGSQKPEARSQ